RPNTGAEPQEATMAIVMSMHWPEASLEEYDQARKDVKWETDVPAGAKFHVAWMADDGLRVLDLWNSAEEVQRFVETRLNPAVARMGIQGKPRVLISPVHAIFAPDVPSPRAAASKAKRPARKKAAARATKARKTKKAPARRARNTRRRR